jgi:hypothetical protein
MEFKFLFVGEELYGKAEDLETRPHGELLRKVTHTDTKTGVEYAF